MTINNRAHFDGADYIENRDHARLSGQILRVYSLMQDGQWRTVDQIADVTGDPQTSISAQLRNLRKERFGSHIVERRYIASGLYEYRVLEGSSDE